MSKGRQAKVGAVNVSANGYAYIKTSTGWRLQHHVLAEQILLRPVDTKTDRIYFKDGNRENLVPDNIGISAKSGVRASSYYRRLHTIEEKMTELVESAEHRDEALRDLKDLVSNVRSLYGFSALP